MFVCREDDSGFIPITIVLESQEEADTMWHKLNCNSDWREYLRRRGIATDEGLDPFQRHTTRMWTDFDRVYQPSIGGDRFG